MINDNDLLLMSEAMALAQRGEGRVNPNPLVGAVIVAGGVIVASGWHHAYGDLHAERDAFRDADNRRANTMGATMYVTLEPCCHHGKQPPCTEAIIGHGIKRVVVGLNDPNPLVAGKGLRLLRDAGIEVDVLEDDSRYDVLADRLRRQNRVFLKYITTGMPWVTAKWAMTLDGKICTSTGDSKWITNVKSRQYVHQMRRTNTGILSGIGTVLSDDPMLNVRIDADTLEDMGIKESDVRQPVRIVADRHARIPLDSRLVTTAREIRTIVAHDGSADKERLRRVSDAGVTLWECGSLKDLLAKAGKDRIDSVMLECGGTLTEALLREGLVDEVAAFIAPKIAGGEGAKTPVEGEGVKLMSQAVELTDISVSTFGEDVLIRGLVKRA